MAMHQISYCFIADIAGQKGVPQFDHGEQAENFKHEWLTLKSATQTLESDQNVADYEGKFIVLRDLTFLRETVKAR